MPYIDVRPYIWPFLNDKSLFWPSTGFVQHSSILVKKAVTTILLIILALVLLVAGFVVFIATTGWGQQIVTQQVNNYLAKKLSSPFRIGRVSYQIPDYVALEDVLFITPKGDTLLSGQRLFVDLDMWGLTKGRIQLNQIDLERVRLNLTRTLPDTTFNFQYLVDAFDTEETGEQVQKADTAAAPLDFNLAAVFLKDVRIKYKDDVAGADVNASVDSLRANLDKTILDKSVYHIKDVTVDGLTAKARIYPGLPATEERDPDPSDTLDLGLGKWQIRRSAWDIQVDEANFQSRGQIGSLAMESDFFYLNGQKIGIRSLQLSNSDIAAILTKPVTKLPPITKATTAQKKEIVKEAKQEVATDPGWSVALKQLQLANNRLRFDDQTQARQPKGLDYGHLDLTGLSLTGQAISYTPDRTSARLRQGKFQDKSGFGIQRLDADVIYANTTTSLTNLLVQTGKPGQKASVIRDKMVLRYDSLAQLSLPAQAGRVNVQVSLRQSTLTINDILQLVPSLSTTPPFAGNQGAMINVNGSVTGTLAALNIPSFDMSTLSGTRLKAAGRLTNVLDTDRMGVDLTISEATTRLADIKKLVPKGSLPDSIGIPNQLRLTGHVKGLLNNLTLDTQLQTDWGTASFDGNLQGFMAGKNQSYQGTLQFARFDLNKWLMSQQYGPATGRATVNGRGIDVKTMNTSFQVAIDEATYNKYRYSKLQAEGRLANGNLILDGNLDDPNARVALNTQVNLNTEYPSINGTVNIANLDVTTLNFYKEPLSMRGNLVINMTSTDPARPIGTIQAQDALIRYQGQDYPIDSLYLRANATGDRKELVAAMPFGQVTLSGLFPYDRLYDIIASEIGRYVSLPQLAYKPVTPPYDFKVDATVKNHPLIKAFVPELTRLDPVRFQAYLDNTKDTTFSATMVGGVVEYDTITVDNPRLSLRAVNNQLSLNGSLSGLRNQSVQLKKTEIKATAANNLVRFQVATKDSVDTDRYAVNGQVAINKDTYKVQLDRRGVLVNYQPWSADTSGFVQYGPQGLLVNRFALRSATQSIDANSIEQYPNAPIRVTLHNLDLSNLAKLANQDTTLASGRMDGTVIVRDYMGDSELSFLGNLYVDSLKVMEKPLGNLTARFTNQSDQKIGVNTTLVGPYNNVQVNGFYNPNNEKQALDLKVNLQRLDARTIEAFSFGELRQAHGQLTGNMDINGSLTKPTIKGSVAFDTVAFNIKQLNATYRIDQERILFNGQTITLDNFDVRDTLGRVLTTNGTVVLNELPDVSYNLNVTAKNFLVLNAGRKDNDYVYGNAAISTNLRIRGKGTQPAVTGTIKVDRESKVTLVLPDETLDANEARQVVTFIAPGDTLALNKYLQPAKIDTIPRIAFEQLSNANISLNLEVDDSSEFTIVIDERNGDNLRARGNANLNVTLNQAGEVQVLGRYEVTEGEYDLTYEVLKRQFAIDKGSYITFTGDPLKADVNITAIYQTQASPANLIANESSGQTSAVAQNRIPFNVVLNMRGNLSNPDLSFDIVIPKENSNVAIDPNTKRDIDNKLSTLRQDQSQINKQVFALLILNSFIAENSSNFFSGGSGGGLDAENLARTSVSKLLTEQLDRFASSIIKGVDVNFNLLSSSQANTSSLGATGTRTDLNVGLSKRFLDGRLSVSVGRNFEIENNTGINRNPNEVFDNLSVNYNLSKDGRYILRGYRQNQASASNSSQGVIYGYVIETGVGFIITVDFDTLKEVFNKNKASEL